MSRASKHTVDMAELAAALGSNVVRFVPPPPPREEPQTGSEWAASLDLIDQVAASFKDSESRASQAEERAEKVAVKAIEGLRTAQLRFEAAETRARQLEESTAEELRLAQQRVGEAEAWAQNADERARDAESRAAAAEERAEAAEIRARDAEEWLRRMTEALRQKLPVGTVAAPHVEPMPELRRRAG
jgi:hypothetical protein